MLILKETDKGTVNKKGKYNPEKRKQVTRRKSRTHVEY